MADYTPTGKPDDVTRYDSRAVRREFELIAEAISTKAAVGASSTVSTTSMLIESPATKTFTAEPNKEFAPGQTVYIADAVNPATNSMTGLLTSYDIDTGEMVVEVTAHDGSGTIANWVIGVSNAAGVTLGSNTFSGAQNFARATRASHPTNSLIWNAPANQINFTGTANVTALPNAPQGGAERVLICADACSFTAGANILIDGVQSGGVLQCAANDIVLVRATSVSTFRLSVTRYAGDNGESSTVSSAVDVTISSAGARLQAITMTALGKKVNLPAATALARGSPIFIIHNTGSYAFSVMNGAAEFLFELKPMQSAVVGCSDTSTIAGVWRVHGAEIDKLDKNSNAVVVNAVDSRALSIAPLTATSAICCYKNNATSKLEAVVLNVGSVNGTPLQIGADNIIAITVAAQTATQATVVYQDTSFNTKAYVLNISGNTITPGTVKLVSTGTTSGAVGLTVLSSTQLLCTYLPGTSAIMEVVFTISASVISLSTDAIAMSGVSNTIQYEAVTVSSTKVLTAMINSGAAAAIRMKIQSITAGVPAPVGSQINLDTFGLHTGVQFGMVLISGDRVLVAQPIVEKASIVLTLVDVSGTTPLVLRTRAIPVLLDSTSVLSCARMTGVDTVFIEWIGASRGVDAIFATVGADNAIYISPESKYVDSANVSGFGYVDVCALSATKVLNVCRNSSTYLSAKAIGVAQ